MWVLGAGIDLELAHGLAAERSLGDHALHAATDRILRLTGQHLAEGLRLDATGIAGVAVQHLTVSLARGHLDLGGIDHYHMVTGVHMRGEDRLVLAAQQAGNFGAQTTKDHALGVDDMPLALNLAGFRGISTHRFALAHSSIGSKTGLFRGPTGELGKDTG
jgi:hypothetical protein